MKSSRGKAGLKLLLAGATVLAVIPLTAGPSSAVQFCNTAPITIPVNEGGPPQSGAPYPSTINVSGMSGTITDVNLLLNDFSLITGDLPPAYSSDVDVMLVGPTGASIIPFSDVGDNNVDPPPFIPPSAPLDFVIDDQAPNPLPADTPLSSGSFRPTDDDDDADESLATDQFLAPAPAPSGATALSTFNGTNPNGTWRLYVIDDFGGPQTAQFAGGWCVDILTTGGGTTTTMGGGGTTTSSAPTTTSTAPTTTTTRPATTTTTLGTTTTTGGGGGTTTTTRPSTTTTSAPPSTTTTTTGPGGGTCFGAAATIVGTEGADSLVGTEGNDVIVGLGGNDSIDGRGGNDLICAGAGADSVSGGTGNDTISGGDGNDSLVGSFGDDNLQGDAGNDNLVGGSGNDSHTGGVGTDICKGGDGLNSFATCETQGA